MYQKINRNSLGQQLRRREVMIHQSTEVIPASEKWPWARSVSLRSQFKNPLRVNGSRRQAKGYKLRTANA